MTATMSRAVMELAVRCLGETRREWARAIQAEFETALTEGKPLTFAVGCLMAASQELPRHEEGRFVLASYALVLGVIVPMAALQMMSGIVGFPYLISSGVGLGSMLPAGSAQEALFGSTYQAATPSMLALLLSLGAGHLRLAWVLLERDWQRVLSAGAMTAAVTMTLIIILSALFLDGTQAALPVAAIIIELATIFGLAQWHARLGLRASPEGSTGSP